MHITDRTILKRLTKQMLNMEIHKVQSSKCKVQSVYANLLLDFGMHRHPELDSGSHASLQPETSKVWTNRNAVSSQKQNAYDACLTKMDKSRRGKERLNTLSVIHSGNGSEDPLCISPRGGKLLPFGEIERGQKTDALRAALTKKISNDPTLIALRYPNNKHNENCNMIINRIDKTINQKRQSRLLSSSISPFGGIPEGKGVTNKTKTFCNFDSKEFYVESQNTLFVPCSPVARISPHFLKGESHGRQLTDGWRGFDLIHSTIPGRMNRTSSNKNKHDQLVLLDFPLWGNVRRTRGSQVLT